MASNTRKTRSNGFSKTDYEVAEILSDMPNLVARFECLGFWRCKGTRTAVRDKWLTAPMEANGPLTSNNDVPLDILPKKPKEKSKQFRIKRSQKTKREELSAEIVNLNLERESLMAELLKFRHKCDELKVINSELKAKQRKSRVGDEEGKTNVDMEIKNSATSEFPQDNQTIECKQDHHPSADDQTAKASAKKSIYPSGQSNAIDPKAPLPEEYSGMESCGSPRVVERSKSKMMPPEARQRRVKKICRNKPPLPFKKPQWIYRNKPPIACSSFFSPV